MTCVRILVREVNSLELVLVETEVGRKAVGGVFGKGAYLYLEEILWRPVDLFEALGAGIWHGLHGDVRFVASATETRVGVAGMDG